MKNLFLASLFSMTIIPAAFGATPTTKWWLQPSICRPSTNNCYPSMGAGYDNEAWDTSGNCRGKKLICPEALTNGETSPTPMSKAEIASARDISADFDISVLAAGCFGARKTAANGTLVSINNGQQYVKVWCSGVLNNASDSVPGGEITTGEQPTCKSLARDGYVATLNGKCYGKYYNPAEYHIECADNDLMPQRIIILNGADIMTAGADDAPERMSDATDKFKSMQATSLTQRAKYFTSVD